MNELEQQDPAQDIFDEIKLSIKYCNSLIVGFGKIDKPKMEDIANLVVEIIYLAKLIIFIIAYIEELYLQKPKVIKPQLLITDGK